MSRQGGSDVRQMNVTIFYSISTSFQDLARTR